MISYDELLLCGFLSTSTFVFIYSLKHQRWLILPSGECIARQAYTAPLGEYFRLAKYYGNCQGRHRFSLIRGSYGKDQGAA